MVPVPGTSVSAWTAERVVSEIDLDEGKASKLRDGLAESSSVTGEEDEGLACR